MNIPPLDINLIRQDPESDDCLRACALMILKYYNDPIKKETLWKKLHAYKKHSGLKGAYLQDLGSLAIKLGYQATIYHYDWGWWDEETASESTKGKKTFLASLKRLKKEKKSWPDKKSIEKDIKFVKTGGKFRFSFPKIENIDFNIVNRIPVILSTNAQFLYHQPKSEYDHSIVIVGKENEDYLIRDPLYGLEKIDKDNLFLAWCKASGWMLIIKKRTFQKEDLKIRQPKLKF